MASVVVQKKNYKKYRLIKSYFAIEENSEKLLKVNYVKIYLQNFNFRNIKYICIRPPFAKNG